MVFKHSKIQSQETDKSVYFYASSPNNINTEINEQTLGTSKIRL